MNQEGPNSPGIAADDNAIGDMAWDFFDRIKVEDGSNAFINVGWGLEGTTHYLKATNFGFSIPNGAIINGILVEIKQVHAISVEVNENEIKIVKSDGSIGTTNKSTGAVPPSPLAYVSYGGPSDLWGESWSDTDINDIDFGVVISFVKTTGEGMVDHIRITVYYTMPPPPSGFPWEIYSPREKQNKKGIIYDADKKEIGYAEDITKLDDEVVAIEDFLLPQYIFAHENNIIPVAEAGTFQDIPFDEAESTPKVGIEHDHEENPEQFKIKKAGVYLINMTCSFSDSAVVPDSNILIRIVKNGVEIHGSLLEKDIAGGPQQDKDKTITNSILVACALDDIIKFQFTSDNLTVSLDSDATYGDHKDTATINIIRIA